MKGKLTALVATSLVLGASSLSASNCCPFSGFYVGVSGGIHTSMSDVSLNTSAKMQDSESLDQSVRDSLNADIYELKPTGDIFIGYGWQGCGLYFGLKAGVNFTNFDLSATSTAQNDNQDFGNTFISVLDDKVKGEMRTAEFYVDLKPGIVICRDTLLFGIVGAGWNKGHVKGHSTYSLTDTSGPTTYTASLSPGDSKDRWSWRVGIGLEKKLSRCLSLQLNYLYSSYQSISENATGPSYEYNGTEIANGHVVHFKADNRRQATSIGLAYYF